VLLDDGDNRSFSMLHADGAKLGNGLTVRHLDEAGLRKSFPQARHIFGTAAIHHDDFEWRRVLLREDRRQTVIDKRLSDDGSNDHRKDGCSL
jgi:hypothetical protein